MKKFFGLMSIFLISFYLVGCGYMAMGSRTIINKDGSGDFRFKVIYDDIVAGKVNGGILQNTIKSKSKDNIQKYTQNNKFVEEYRKHFNDIREINSISSGENDFVVKVEKKGGLTKNTYTYKMYPPKNFNPKAIAKVFMNKDETVTASSGDDSIVNEFIKSVVFTNSVSLPGEIVNSNAVETKGNELTWTYYINQLNPEVVMTATYTIENNTSKMIIGVISVLTVALGIGYIIKSKKKISN